ncbi:glycosyltransferase [Aestuariimicrobium ganziense]|uniref:glycosyltransferase n=1 Tax=Aestuariimicrobium ganziense TaxID=2773677 RepID=UPI00194293BA|nr:glycosyltransferase [Aestuariimicrobium ganziense]
MSATVADHQSFDYRVRFVRADKTHLVDEFVAAGVMPQRLGERTTGRFGWLRDLRRELSESDVVHSHSPVLSGVARLITRTLPPSTRPALLVTEHNEWSSHRLPTRWLNGLTAWVDARRWAVSDQVLATMWPSAQKRTTVLIHGIDAHQEPVDPSTRARVRQELGLAEDDVLAITVANLRHNKDYPNLLRATAVATRREPRLRVVSVGQGPLEQELKALHRQLGLAESFRFLGFRRDVAELMAAADVFVLGSAHEGLPVAIMEAFAAGLPVVATRVGGVPQQVRHEREGLLVPAGDPEALASALVRLTRDRPVRAALAAGASSRAGDYDIRRAVAVQEAAYAELGRTR